MRKTLVSIALCSFFLSVPDLARAQSRSAPDAKVFVGGMGGVTFGGTNAGATIGGRVGFRIARNFHVFGEINWTNDVIPNEIRDELDQIQDFLEPGDVFNVSVRSTIFGGGVRWSLNRGRLSPFAEAAVGAARLKAGLEVRIFGQDFTDEILEEIGEDLTTTQFALTVGGGMNIFVSRTASIDAGIKYRRIYTDVPDVNQFVGYVEVLFAVKR